MNDSFRQWAIEQEKEWMDQNGKSHEDFMAFCEEVGPEYAAVWREALNGETDHKQCPEDREDCL